MHIVMGATGHVGSAVVDALLDAGEPVTAVVRDAGKGDVLRARGVEFVVADAHDADALRTAFRRGDRAFLLNPPADPKVDTDAEERSTVAAILAALDGSGLKKVVAASTYGAQPGERIGDLSVLYAFEQGLADQPIPAAINRGAYYYTNWDMMLRAVRESGLLHTPYPPDRIMPMVSPVDLGRAAAARLRSGSDDAGLDCVEGPERYTTGDVAMAFADALGHSVAVQVIPRDDIERSFRALGFSAAAADAYARMTRISLDGLAMPESPRRGSVTLQAHIKDLIRRDLSDA